MEQPRSTPPGTLGESARWNGEEEEGPSLLGFVNLMLRHRRILIALPLVGFLVGACLAVLRPTSFTAESAMIPQSAQSGSSRIAGLAAQLGVNVGSEGSGESLAFYAALLRSRELLREAVQSEYRVPIQGDTLRGTLMDLMEIDPSLPEETRIRVAVSELSRWVNSSIDLNLGLVKLETTAPWSALALQLNQRLLDMLNEFNVKRRQSQAAMERQFVGERLDTAQTDLQMAEAAFERFLDQNRRYQESPQLMFEAARLQRRIDLAQGVYTSLAQAYEQARIEEVRNTPVITVVERPIGSVRRNGADILQNGIIMMTLGGLLAVGFVVGREILARQREGHPQEYREFVELRRAAAHDLAPGRLLGKGRSDGAAAAEVESGRKGVPPTG